MDQRLNPAREADGVCGNPSRHHGLPPCCWADPVKRTEITVEESRKHDDKFSSMLPATVNPVDEKLSKVKSLLAFVIESLPTKDRVED